MHPPKKLGVAVLGLGGMGGTHVKAAKGSPFVSRIVGYDPSEPARARRSQEFGISTTADLESIFRDPDIQLAFIASPNDTHCDLTVRSLRAGKAVLCEKPMGNTLEEARRMIEAEKATGGFLQIGFECRYSKLYQTAKQWIDAGRIGRPLNSHCDYYCSEFVGRGTWRSQNPYSLIGEKLCHYLDLPRWWFGEEVADVYSVAAPNVVTYFNHPDNHQIVCRHRNGAVSTLTFFMHTAQSFGGDPLGDVVGQQADDGHRLTYLMYGDKGAIELDVFHRRARRWEFTDTGKGLKSKLVETVTFSHPEDQVWYHNVHGQNLRIAELVATGQRPETAAADSFESMKLVFAAERSEHERRIVALSEL